MSHKTITLVLAVFLMVSAAVIVVSDFSDADDIDTGKEEAASGEAATVTGTCGTGGATWTYKVSDHSLTINASGTSNKVSGGFDPSSKDWTVWQATSFKDESGKDADRLMPYALFDTNSITLSISGNVSIDAGAFKDFNITSIALSNCTTISAGAFQGCTNLTSVSIGTSVTSIGKGAFQDCTALTTVDIHKAQVDHDAFKGCSKLTSIKATDSTLYDVGTNGIVYSDDWATVYMCPTGLKPSAPIVLDDRVTKVFLDFADVTYIADICRAGGSAVTYEKVSETDCKAVCVLYSSLGMKDPKASMSGSDFVLTYGELYRGWIVDEQIISLSQGTPELDTSKGTVSFSVTGGNGYTLLPMGVAVMTPNDISDVKSINGWEVGNVDAEASEMDGILTDVIRFSGNVIGYEENGPAETTLGRTLIYNGVQFSVLLLQPVPGSMNAIERLTIDDDLQFSEGTFANCTNLRNVYMDEVKEIPAQAFRYCTALEVVSIGSCTSVGDYAFEGCSSLADVAFIADSVILGKGAFNNCSSLRYLLAMMDTTISGDAGIPIIHLSENASGDLEVTDNYVLLDAPGFSSISYTYSKGGESTTANVYSGGAAAIPLNGSGEVFLTYKEGTPSTDCLVVFDAVLDVIVPSQVVKAGSTIGSVPAPSVDGYTFMGWVDASGAQLTEDTRIDSSTLFTAQWQKENSSSNTPVYVLAIFAIAIVATVAVLFVNSRR